MSEIWNEVWDQDIIPNIETYRDLLYDAVETQDEAPSKEVRQAYIMYLEVTLSKWEQEAMKRGIAVPKWIKEDKDNVSQD